MNTLVFFTIAYLVVTIAIGLYAARFVSTSKDYLVAGRGLPLYMNVATVFATWFGAETVLSVSATFVKDGLGGIPADPFGATFCLIFVALFFARAFYRLDLLTIGDFYKKRYGKGVEVLTSLAVTLSYLGWTSAQLTALGIVFNSLSQGAITLDQGILLGAVIVLIYTTFGGMWSVALTDLFQSVVIVLGLIYVAVLATGMVGRLRQRGRARLGGGQVLLLAHRRQQGMVGLRRGLGHARHRLHPAAGRVPARDQRQEREHGGEGLAPGRRAPTSPSPSCRCISPMRRSWSTRRW